MTNFLIQFAAEPAAEKSGLAVLGLNPVSLFLQLATFLLLFAIIKRFALKSIVGMLDDRRKTINAGIRLGRKMEAEHAKLEAQVAETLRKTRREADEIIAGAHSEAGEIMKAAEIAAEQKAATILGDAQGQIAALTSAAKARLEHEAAELVAEATAAIINEKLDPAKDRAMIQKALSEARR